MRSGRLRLVRVIVPWAVLASLLVSPVAAQPRTPPGDVPQPPPPPAPAILAPKEPAASLIPSGYLPDELRARLAAVSGAELSRACGNLESPWAFRGKAGRRLALRDYGRRGATPEQARRLATYLLEEPVDTAYLAPGAVLSCEASHAPPGYLVRFSGGDRPTFALVRFDIAAIVLFDSELPLGLIAMGEHADTLWNALSAFFEDDPAFRRARPAPTPLRGRGVVRDTTDGAMRPDYAFVAQLPTVLERPAPNYPEEAVRMKTEGTVHVQALIGADGFVRDAVVRTGPPVLREAALEAIWQWRFQPAMDGGRPIGVWAMIPVNFKLN
jgi:TonB family protein